jgi:hypothetical protein
MTHSLKKIQVPAFDYIRQGGMDASGGVPEPCHSRISGVAKPSVGAATIAL